MLPATDVRGSKLSTVMPDSLIQHHVSAEAPV